MRKRGEKRKGHKLKKKVEESKNKAKLEKSQPQKGKCDVNNEEMHLPKVKMMKTVLFFPSVVLSIQMKVMCGCVATAVRQGMI